MKFMIKQSRVLFTFSALTLFFFVAGCSKGDDPPPTPPPVPDPSPVVKPDTLTSGWKKVVIDTTDFFTDVIFNTNSNGYLAGKKLYRSSDGGLTWKVVANMRVNNLAVTNDGKVFLVDWVDIIYRSTNGGNTLSSFKIPGAMGFDAFFIDNNKGYYITDKGLYFTEDGGDSWNLLNTPGIDFFNSSYSSLFFTSNTNGFITTTLGFYRLDGSVTSWKKSSFTGPLPYSNYHSVAITPDNTVYVTTQMRQVYKSIDGGFNFSLIKEFPWSPGTFCDVHFIDNNVGYVSYGNRIYKTTDGGNTWSVVVALGEVKLIEIHFTDANHGWACGSKGTILTFN